MVNNAQQNNNETGNDQLDISESDKQLYGSFANNQEKNELAEVLKELFQESKIEMITELSDDEISLMTRILIIAEMKDITAWQNGLGFFMKLKLSKGRESRKELLRAISGYSQQRSMMSRMNPTNWFNKGKM